MKKQKYIEIYECPFCCKHHRGKKEALKCFDSHKNKLCVSCFSKITILDNTWYDNATEFILNCNYGSKHDMEIHSLALCDKCLDKYLNHISKVKISKSKGE